MIAKLTTGAAYAILAISPLQGQELKLETATVRYFEDSVMEHNDERLTLLGGTEWLFALPPLLPILPITKVLVVVEDRDNRTIGYFTIRRRTHIAILVRGQVSVRTAVRTWVTRKMGDGAVLQTADGRFWSVQSYDQYHTRFWLPPYKVLITGESSMLNLDENERVSVKPER